MRCEKKGEGQRGGGSLNRISLAERLTNNRATIFISYTIEII
jgi:hypothetical protein